MAKRTDDFTKAREVALSKLFRTHGITGSRRQYPITGRPDFAFPKLKAAVFVDGCFWHGCPKHCSSPKATLRSGRRSWLRTRRGTGG